MTLIENVFGGFGPCLLIPSIGMVILTVVILRQLAELQQRMGTLEADHKKILDRVEHIEGEQSAEPGLEEETAAPVPQNIPVVHAARSTPPPVPQRSPSRAAPALELEALIGGRALGWVAVVLLLFATAFFVKHAFDNNWLDELGRVILGAVVGTILCVGGYRLHRKGWRVFAQMLTAAGIVLLYLVTFASFGVYHLIPRGPASLFFVLIVAEAALLALLYDAPSIAVMAVFGGLLTPVLLPSDHDEYVSLFLYLMGLNVGVVLLGLARRWWVMMTLALAGTQFLFWSWYEGNFHPDKRTACVLFQSALFALYFVHPLLLALRREFMASVEDLGRLLLNALFVAGAGYVLLEPVIYLGTHGMGSQGLSMACLYALFVWLLQMRKSTDARLQFTALAVAMGFLARVLPLELQGSWTSIGWAVQGLCLVIFGQRIKALPLRFLGSGFLLLAVFRVLLPDLWEVQPGPYIPFFNRHGLAVLAVSACVLWAAWQARRMISQLHEVDKVGMWFGGIAGLGLLWYLATFDTYMYFEVQYPEFQAGGGLRRDLGWATTFTPVGYLEAHRSAVTSISVVWALYAAALLGLGFWTRNAAMRWAALGLFALTLGKVVLLDMADLPGLYRVAAFAVLAVVLGAATWAYQRFANLKESPTGGNQ